MGGDRGSEMGSDGRTGIGGDEDIGMGSNGGTETVSVGGMRWGPKMKGDEVYGWEVMEVQRREVMSCTIWEVREVQKWWYPMESDSKVQRWEVMWSTEKGSGLKWEVMGVSGMVGNRRFEMKCEGETEMGNDGV